jgi:hypothetical protein
MTRWMLLLCLTLSLVAEDLPFCSSFGITVSDNGRLLQEAVDDGSLTRPAIICASVSEGSDAARIGLLRDDLLLSLNGRALQRGRQLEVLLGAIKANREVTFEVMRGGSRTLLIGTSTFDRGVGLRIHSERATTGNPTSKALIEKVMQAMAELEKTTKDGTGLRDPSQLPGMKRFLDSLED